VTSGHDRRWADRIVLEAVQQIRSLDRPFDPGNIKLWFNYCAGTNSALNTAVNALLAANDQPAERQWDLILDEFTS
jgi:hypothetical protein